MTAIKITNFDGITPLLAERLLPDNGAQTAANTKLTSGELRPMRKAKKVYTPVSPVAVESIFKVDESTWFVWPSADVRCVRAPYDGESRFVYTGDGVPKVTTKTLGTPVGASGVPAAARTLGIPAPKATPTVTPSGGTVPTTSRFYCYTFYSDWDEESSPSPVSALITGNVNGTWAVSGMDDTPRNSGTVTGATHSAGVVTVTVSATHYLRAGDLIQIAGVVGMTDLNTTHTVTEVVSNTQFKVALTTAQSYTSGGSWQRTYPWGACTKRIYRTAGSTGAWQLVAEGVTGTTYNDTLLDAQILGDALISDGWDPPPVAMKGIVSLPNGSMAGFDGQTVYLSEPFQPHAWPAAYQKGRKSNFPIVGISATADGTIVVATEGMPYIITGYEPATMIMQRVEEPVPCLSAKSVCSVGSGVVYATRGGLVLIGQAGPTMLTSNLFSDEDWYALSPETMRCEYARGFLYLFSSADPAQVFIMHLANGGNPFPMVTASIRPDATHVDEKTGKLYFAFLKKVFEFDPDDGVPLVQNWWSKEFVLAKQTNLGAAKVVFSEEYTEQAKAAFAAELAALIAENQSLMASGLSRGSINRHHINQLEINGSVMQVPTSDEPVLTLQLYAGGKLRFTRTITKSGKIVRLPSGYKDDVFSVRVIANTHVRSIELADTALGIGTV